MHERGRHAHRHTDTHTDTAWRHKPRLCIASRGKNDLPLTCTKLIAVDQLGSGVSVSVRLQIFTLTGCRGCPRWWGKLSARGKCPGGYVRGGNYQGDCPTLCFYDVNSSSPDRRRDQAARCLTASRAVRRRSQHIPTGGHLSWRPHRPQSSSSHQVDDCRRTVAGVARRTRQIRLEQSQTNTLSLSARVSMPFR